MPTAASATLQVSLNGGATQTGGITAANGDVVQLSGMSTVGWVQQKYEIYSFYSVAEFPLPSGWTLDAGTGAYYYSAGAVPPPFTLPAGPAFGKFLLRLTVNNGLNSANHADPTLLDEATALSIASPAGLLDLAWAENRQFSLIKKWVGDYQINLRALDGSIGAASSPSGTVASVTPSTNTAGALNTFSRGDHAHPLPTAAPSVTVKSDASTAAVGTANSVLRTDAQLVAVTAAPVTIGTGNSSGASTSLARADHVHNHGVQSDSTHHALATASLDGFMVRTDKSKLDAATPLATVSTLVSRDSGGLSAFVGVTSTYFASSAANVAAAGLLRGVSNSRLVAARNAANSADAHILDWDNADGLTIGEATNVANLDATIKSTGLIRFIVGTVKGIGVNADGVQFFGNPDLGGGAGVVGLGLATTAPTANPAGIVYYAEPSTGVFKSRSLVGVITTLAPVGVAGATTKLLDRIYGYTQLVGAVTNTLLTLPVPATNTVVTFHVSVHARRTSDGATAFFERIVRAKRVGAGALLVGTPAAVVPDDDETTASVTIAINPSGNNILVQMSGTVLLTFDVDGEAWVRVLTP